MIAKSLSSSTFDIDLRIKYARLLTNHEFVQYKNIIHRHESDYWVSCGRLNDDTDMTFVSKTTNELEEAPKGCVFAISPVIEIEARTIRDNEISEKPNIIFMKGEIVSFAERLWIAIGAGTLFCCGNIGYGSYSPGFEDLSAEDIMNKWISTLKETSDDVEPCQFIKISPAENKSGDCKCELCGTTKGLYYITYGFDSRNYLGKSPFVNEHIMERTSRETILCYDCKKLLANNLKNTSCSIRQPLSGR